MEMILNFPEKPKVCVPKMMAEFWRIRLEGNLRIGRSFLDWKLSTCFLQNKIPSSLKYSTKIFIKNDGEAGLKNSRWWYSKDGFWSIVPAEFVNNLRNNLGGEEWGLFDCCWMILKERVTRVTIRTSATLPWVGLRGYFPRDIRDQWWPPVFGPQRPFSCLTKE